LTPIISGFHDVYLRCAVVRERPALVKVRYDWESDAFVEASASAEALDDNENDGC
jgi:hypothetical protein